MPKTNSLLQPKRVTQLFVGVFVSALFAVAGCSNPFHSLPCDAGSYYCPCRVDGGLACADGLGCEEGICTPQTGSGIDTHKNLDVGSHSDTRSDSVAGTDSVDIDTNTAVKAADSDTETQTHSDVGTDTETIIDDISYVTEAAGEGSIGLVAAGKALSLVVDSDDYAGVLRAAEDLQADIHRVTSVQPAIIYDEVPVSASEAVIIGTLGRSDLIDGLVQTGKLDVSAVLGKWETYILQVVEAPVVGVNRALVIAGSDQRGTIFGIYDLSSEIGVSPWYFWDDIPPKQKNAIWVLPGPHSDGEPAVKYRGFFINDENPALQRWVAYSSLFNSSYVFESDFYIKVFELMLRLKANYLWPAVWGRAFAEDDPLNHAKATEYGIVMGTSHEAPMMRGIEEWNRNPDGSWDFKNNYDGVTNYWRFGIERMVNENIEGIVTLGMRGTGDEAVSPNVEASDMGDIISTQRDIIAEMTGKPIGETPQVWTLYKEVQDWWVKDGLRVPSDVTVIWCDDNFGNIRKLPDLEDAPREGGYGVYYHFDYVGGPRNYKWADTNLIANIWEQMHLAYAYGVNRIWMVNVGDIKNEELPLQFFLDYAWNPDAWSADRLHEWEYRYAAQQFGPEYAEAIAQVLRGYATLQSDRKPELLNRKVSLANSQTMPENSDAIIYTEGASPFSLTHYDEIDRVTNQWVALAQETQRIADELPQDYQDAFYQLVYYPVKASALIYEMRRAGFKNLYYHAQGRAATNDMADLADAKFSQFEDMNAYYNNDLAGGKWNGFQSQPVVGYGGDYANSSWQQPETNGSAAQDFLWPDRVRLDVPVGAHMGIAVDGSDQVWPGANGTPELPTFSPFQTQPTQYIDVFNRGADGFSYTITKSPNVDWLTITPSEGSIDDSNKEVRTYVTVNGWDRVPQGLTSVSIVVTDQSSGSSVAVDAVIDNQTVPAGSGFVEANGYVSIEADHYSEMVDSNEATWMRIPDLGRTGAAMTPTPVTISSQTPEGNTPRLEYDMHIFNPGQVTVWIYASPRNNVLHETGIRYGISFNDDPPQIVNITTALNGVPTNRSWERNVSDNANLTTTTHSIGAAGSHVLKFWMVDPTMVVQKIVVDTGGLKESYLGPPESYRVH